MNDLEQELKLLQEQCDWAKKFDEENPSFAMNAPGSRYEHVKAVARINSILQLMNDRLGELENATQSLRDDTHG